MSVMLVIIIHIVDESSIQHVLQSQRGACTGIICDIYCTREQVVRNNKALQTQMKYSAQLLWQYEAPNGGKLGLR